MCRSFTSALADRSRLRMNSAFCGLRSGRSPITWRFLTSCLASASSCCNVAKSRILIFLYQIPAGEGIPFVTNCVGSIAGIPRWRRFRHTLVLVSEGFGLLGFGRNHCLLLLGEHAIKYAADVIVHPDLDARCFFNPLHGLIDRNEPVPELGEHGGEGL